MKVFHIILLFAVTICLGACAVAEQSTDDVGRQFQEGLTGRGQIVTDDPTSDSFGSVYR